MASPFKVPQKESFPLPPLPPLPQSTNKINDVSDKNPNMPSRAEPVSKPVLSLSPEDLSLSMSSHLTRQELIRRRLHHIKQLSRVYRDHYWVLMEELRVQYREYYWRYGISPYQEEEERERERERETAEREIGTSYNVEGSGETNNNNNNLHINGTSARDGNLSNGVGGGVNGAGGNGAGKLGLGFGENGTDSKSLGGHNRCAFVGCKLKAMALTSYCHLHILSDPQQKLYKACNYVIKSAQAGPIICGKPILRSTVPFLCNAHFQKAQKHVSRALKKAGLNVSSSSKLAPNFHVVVAEYIREIQIKRRAASKPKSISIVPKEEGFS